MTPVVAALSFLFAPFLSAWRRRAVLRELSLREVQSAFSGSMLGLGWVVLQPLATLTVYALVFGVILEQNAERGGMTYVSHLFTGLIFFHAFSESVTRASRVVLSRPNYVTKVVFPLDLLPWPPVASAALHGGASLVLLLALHTIFVGMPAWTAITLPLLLVVALLLGLAVSLVLASLGVYVRDTSEIVRVAVQLLFFLTPIVWTLDQAKNELLHGLLMLNPLAIVIEAARAAMNGSGSPGLWPMVTLVLGTLLATALGHAFFRRTQDGFADVL